MRTARMAMMLILAMLTTLTVQAAADKTALDAAISEADAYNSSILESHPKAAEVLTMLINACKTKQNDADATQEDVDFATKFMNESMNQCKIAVAQTNYAAARVAAGLAAKYYDLQGRLSQPSRAGVYINNGVVKVNK